MTQDDVDPEFLGDLNEFDLEMPEDGRDSQPPEEGSSDDPESLEAEDPLRDDEAVLTDTAGPNSLIGQAAEPVKEDDWALEEERVVDEDGLDPDLNDEDLR